MDQPTNHRVWLQIPLSVSWTRKMIFPLSLFAPGNYLLVFRNGFGHESHHASVRPFSKPILNLVLSPRFSLFPRWRISIQSSTAIESVPTLLGHAVACRWYLLQSPPAQVRYYSSTRQLEQQRALPVNVTPWPKCYVRCSQGCGKERTLW